MRLEGDFGLFKRSVERGRALARQTPDALAVGTVGENIEIDDGVVFPDERAHVDAQRQLFMEDHDAVHARAGIERIVYAQLAAAAEHALGQHAAQLAGFDFLAAGQLRAVEADGNDFAAVQILRAGYDLQRPLAAHVDLADPEVIGIRVALQREHAAGDDVVNFGAKRLIALHAGAGEHHAVGIDRRVGGNVGIFANPIHRCFHNNFPSLCR